jgi:glycosyltransferase involved in cell wall biosynthesis
LQVVHLLLCTKAGKVIATRAASGESLSAVRVAYVVGAYPAPSETFIEREVEALAARGVEVEVFPLWPCEEESARRGRVHRCPGFSLAAELSRPGACLRWDWYFARRVFREGKAALWASWRLGQAFQMARRMRELSVQRVHAHFANGPSTLGWVAASVAGVPFSFSVHARDVFVEPQFFRAKARAADRIVACNSAVAKRAAELVDESARSKIALVPHGLPLARYAFRSEPPSGEPMVLGVGRLVEKKGFIHLVRAVARLRQRGRAVSCWLIGDGPEREPLQREIAQLRLADAVELKGWLSQDEVVAAYGRAFVLAVPSLVARDGDMDGLPNVVVEAAAMGVPIVATNVGGIGDLVRDGDTGLVALPGDPEDLAGRIEKVLADPEGAAARALRARQEVEARFDQEKCIPALLDALGISRS